MSEDPYDVYLDACLLGEIEEPASFFARHPGIDTEERRRIETLHEVIADAPDHEVPFERLGGYRLLRRLGRGSMGHVYLAVQEALDRIVALKVIRPELQASDTAVRRFEREARAIAKLRHPHIVHILELAEHDGIRYIAMDLVPGRPLDEILAQELPHTTRVLAWAQQLAEALDYAHRQGIVHRDVKPGNILITPDDRAVLLDFGMARLAEATRMTQSFAGSPSYAAPEQLSAGDVDGRTDVYGLGVTLYECLTGALPFRGETMESIFSDILAGDPTPPRRLHPGLSAEIETVVLKAMEKRPAHRYATAADLAADLQALRQAQPVRARPPGLGRRLARRARRRPVRATALVALLVALVAYAGLALYQRWDDRRTRAAEARRMVAAADRRVAAYAVGRESLRALEARYQRLLDDHNVKYTTTEEDAAFDAVARAREERVRERRAAFLEILELLRSAERLAPDVAGADAVRARLYLAKMQEALHARDHIAADIYREQLEKHDVGGVVTGALRRAATITIDSDPRGAAVHLFRYRSLAELRAHGDRRLVPVPHGVDPDTLPLGEPALRVVGRTGAFAPGDVIVDIDAAALRTGVVVKRYHNGAWRRDPAPEGLAVRPTAAARFLHPASRIGTTPLRRFALEPGPFQLVLACDGCEDLLFSSELGPGESMDRKLQLNPRGATPEGFVYVAQEDYWIQEREVTCAEYLEFLNAPATLATIRASSRPIRFPRHPQNDTKGGDWRCGADGTYVCPWPPDTAIMGVSYEDAAAYAAWRSRRDGRTYAIPTRDEWTHAANGYMSRLWPWGNEFRAKWTSSCFSKPQVAVEPVLSYPIDESPFGAFDMAGSVAEWIDDRVEPVGYRRLGGASWAHANPKLFNVWIGLTARPDVATHSFGIRLVIRRGGR